MKRKSGAPAQSVRDTPHCGTIVVCVTREYVRDGTDRTRQVPDYYGDPSVPGWHTAARIAHLGCGHEIVIGNLQPTPTRLSCLYCEGRRSCAA
jgi:hypothetical protein